MTTIRLLSPIACALGVALALGGCTTTMSGLDAKTEFGCKAPQGVRCDSMSGVYANMRAGTLPGSAASVPTAVSPAKAAGDPGTAMTRPISSGMPIRTAPLVLRVWMAPWVDGDDNLHDQSYVYLPVNSGRWLIEHNQRRIQDAYRPIRPPQAQAAPQPPVAQAGAGARPPQAADADARTRAQQQAADAINALIRPQAARPEATDDGN